MNATPVLSARISASYPRSAPVLEEVSLELARGEILGLVGESGCGKSTLALAILRLLHLRRGTVTGSIRLNGRDILPLRERHMRRLRGREVALVLQSPLSALNPALRIGAQLWEAWRAHEPSSTTGEWQHALHQALHLVRLPDDPAFLRRRPAELSVGQAQRVLIGMAVLHRPALLIADEATSALDLITQAEILSLFSNLARTLGTAILYISHDLLSVATISHRVAVLHKGRIVESSSTQDLFLHPAHPYTQSLIAALPALPRFAPQLTPEPAPHQPQSALVLR